MTQKNRHLGTISQVCRAISLQLRHASTIEKSLLDNNTSSTCPHNMANFGPLTADIGSGVWDTPANFNGFRVLAALLHSTVVVGVSQTTALNRGRHLHSAGRPSRWALAHILVVFSFFIALSLFGSVRRIKLAIRQLLGTRKNIVHRIISYRKSYILFSTFTRRKVPYSNLPYIFHQKRGKNFCIKLKHKHIKEEKDIISANRTVKTVTFYTR